MMMLFLRLFAIHAVGITACGAYAQTGESGNELLPACKAFVERKGTQFASQFQVGVCAGEIGAM
jgi:hypothetical protein